MTGDEVAPARTTEAAGPQSEAPEAEAPEAGASGEPAERAEPADAPADAEADDRPAPDPPAGLARAAGGLLGAAAGEALARRTPPGTIEAGPVTNAVVDLAHAYVARGGQGTPLDLAAELDGVPAPAWLLAVAVVRPYSSALTADALRLANAAGVPGHALSHCVSYVELAAGLFGGRTAAEAIDAATDAPTRRVSSVLTLCGEPHLDALTAGVWALTQPDPVDDMVEELARLTPPPVCAAAAALLGLRDGADVLPAAWRDDVPGAATCLALAGELLRVRRNAYLHRSPPPRPRPTTGPARPAPEPFGAGFAGPAGPANRWSWSARR
jgi:hypothetical protein